MRARFQPSIRHCEPLVANWSMLSTEPDLAPTPAALHAWLTTPAAASEPWRSIPGPSTVAAALRAVGAWSLDGPPRRFDADDWWFRAVFDAPPDTLDGGRHRWIFDGLAGLCEVWFGAALAPTPLLKSANTHRSWTVDMPPLAPTGNELLMRFASIDRWLEAGPRAESRPRRPRPRWRAPMVEQQQLRFLRAPLFGRTPGWSPPAAPVGPWRGVRLAVDRRVEVDELRLVARVDGTTGRVEIRFRLRPLDADPRADTRVERIDLALSRSGSVHLASARPERGDVHAAALEVPDAALWWPHTHGEPALYAARLRIHLASGAPIELDLGSIGFRTIAVDTRHDDFALSVNGVPVFCRGACWMPLDPVGLVDDAARTLAALVTARDAGLNMLRVPGVGVYADDAWFDACDALGLLVWHDFAFANLDYPEHDPAFAADVRAEATEQLERWQGRASLAVVCGNSEVAQQAAMWGASRADAASPLFETGLAELCARLLPGSFYWPSSAHGGAFPHQTNAGTCSYYGIGAYRRPLDDARRSGLRFATECLAFANVPPDATLARMPGGAELQVHHAGWKARSPRDLGAGWDFDDIRDAYLAMLFRVDPVGLRAGDPRRYLDMSRAVGAEVAAAAFAEWRRPGSSCRGALVWFMRDLWAGAGWGLCDELGVPKAAFHGLRRSAAPIAVFLSDEGTSGIELQVVNDPPRPLEGRIHVALYRDDGLRLDEATLPVHVAAHGGVALPLAGGFDRFIDLNHAYRFGPVEHALVVATLLDADGQRLGEAFHCVGGLPNERRRDVGLEVREVEALGGGGFAVTVATRGFAQSVCFDVPSFVATDDHFHLAPMATRRVRLVPAPAAHRRAGRRGQVSALNAWQSAAFELPTDRPATEIRRHADRHAGAAEVPA